MTVPIWTGGLISSVFFAYLAIMARRWWPLAYLLCIFFAAGTGLLFAVEGSGVVGTWWFFFVVYVVGFPIFRMTRDRLELRRMQRECDRTEHGIMLDLDRGDCARRQGW